jgi:ribosomal protein S6
MRKEDSATKKTEDATQLDMDELQIYEVGFLLSPLISGEKIAEEGGVLKEAIERVGGFITGTGEPKMQALAYTITKRVQGGKQTFKDAYFGWLKFKMLPEHAPAVKAEFEKNENIVRFVIIKSEEEKNIRRATRTYGTPLRRKPVVPRPGTEEPKAAPISDAELDREINLLVEEKV